jgi:hypothetical protein
MFESICKHVLEVEEEERNELEAGPVVSWSWVKSILELWNSRQLCCVTWYVNKLRCVHFVVAARTELFSKALTTAFTFVHSVIFVNIYYYLH